MALSILDVGIIGGGFVGLIGIFFPEILFQFANPVTERKYNKKDAWKYRLGGVVILVIAIVFYVYDNFFL